MKSRLSLLLALLMLPLLAWAEPFVEGKDYNELPFPVRTESGDKIEVVELFWYGCPHCYRLDPLVQSWKSTLADDVQFRYSPAVFGNDWGVHAKVFYTADSLDVLDTMHSTIFNTIHKDGNRLTREQDIQSLFARFGVDEKTFQKTFNSFTVDSKVKQATSNGRAYRATGVPALIVNGKYRIDSTSAGSYERMLKIAEYLVEKERNASGS